jgi:hypothetical protein
MLFNTDGWTDMTKLVVAFFDLANAPKNCDVSTCCSDILHKIFAVNSDYVLIQHSPIGLSEVSPLCVL